LICLCCFFYVNVITGNIGYTRWKTKQNTTHHYTQIHTNDVNNLANWMLLIYTHNIYIKETTQTQILWIAYLWSSLLAFSNVYLSCVLCTLCYTGQINVRENRRGNHKWIIQRIWQHRVHEMKNKAKHNTPLYTNKHKWRK
jgi:hypothetical protein